MEETMFYGFRGNIVFSEQLSIFNCGIDSSKQEIKNGLFNKTFDILEKEKSVQIKRYNVEHYLIFRKKYDNIVHCILAKKTFINKHDYKNQNVIDLTLEDYPYINVFVELKSQKFLIESNTQVFGSYTISMGVVKDIINKILFDDNDDCVLVTNPIAKESDFWGYIEDNSSIYELEFNLTTPNVLGGEDAAHDFLKEVEDATEATNVDLKFSNRDGNLKVKKKDIDSYVKYSSNGGGEWKLRRKSKGGKKKETIRSSDKCVKVNISVPKKSKVLDNTIIDSIIDKFNFIETIKKFLNKGGN